MTYKSQFSTNEHVALKNLTCDAEIKKKHREAIKLKIELVKI